MRLRPATPRDLFRLWRWRNDPIVRANSASTGYVGLIEHARWFLRSLRSEDRRLFVVMVEGRAAGSVRIDFAPGFAEASIALAEWARGNGNGTRAIRLLTRKARKVNRRVIARIRVNNSASIMAFYKAGYRIVARGGGFVVMEFGA